MPKFEKAENAYTSVNMTPRQYAAYGVRRIARNSARSRERDFHVSQRRNTPSIDEIRAMTLLASIGNGRYSTVTRAIGVFAGFDMLYGVNAEPASCVRPSASASCWLIVS